MSAAAAAALVFLGCALSEFAQATDRFPGVFDPLDLVAFAVSVVVCYVLDRRFDFSAKQPTSAGSP